jgi:tetratricopeptide (TPR) repeat protein
MTTLTSLNNPPVCRATNLAFRAAVLLILLSACGGPSKPTQTPPPTPAPSPTGPLIPVPQPTPTPGQKVGNLNVPHPTPEIKFAKADVVFFPLSDETNRGFFMTWEIRHYARVAMTALIAPYAICRIRDDFTVEQKTGVMGTDLKTDFPPAKLAEIGREYDARFVVHPHAKTVEDSTIEATISIVETAGGRLVGSKSARGKPGNLSPGEAQRVLLEASLAAADLLIAALGGKGSVPQEGIPTPQGSQPLLADAESKLRQWSLPATVGALDLAGMTIANEPGDGRAWAITARCYARLALDTERHPARFHRDSRLRSIVAADLARRFTPDAPDVKLAAGEALYANLRYPDAEKILSGFAKDPKYGDETSPILITIRRNFADVPGFEVVGESASEVSAARYFLWRARYAAGQASQNAGPCRQLLQKNPRNVLVAARLSDALAYVGPGAHVSGGAQVSLIAFSEAFGELVPAVWGLDPTGRQIAAQTLGGLRENLGSSVPDNLDGPNGVSQLRSALEALADPQRNSVAMSGIMEMEPKNLLFRLLNLYSQLETATIRHLIEQPLKSGRPLALSLLDSVRLYDRLLIEGLEGMDQGFASWGVFDSERRLVDEVGKAFPADEAAQVFVGLFYRRGTQYFSPPIVTQFFNQSQYAWAHYVPQMQTRTEWAITGETPAQVANRYNYLTFYDQFNAELAYTAAWRIYNLRQYDEAAKLYDRLIRDYPRRLEFRAQHLYVERAQSGKQFDKAAIEKLANDFRNHPDLDGSLLDLYSSAHMTAEAETLCRKILDKNPGHRTAFYQLAALLREQGKLDESDELVKRYVARHPDLTGNAALVDSAGYYYDRRDYDRAAKFMTDDWDCLDTWQGGTILMLGKLKWARGDFDGARAEFEREYQRYGLGNGLVLIAQCEALRGNWDEVLKQAERMHAKRPAHLEGWWLKGLYYLHKGNLAEGEKSVTYGRGMMAHSSDAFFNLGYWRYFAGNFSGALAACDEGRRFIKTPMDVDLDMLEFRTRLALGDAKSVRPIVDRMKLFMPSQNATNICEVLWLLDQKDIPAARAVIDAARRWNPRNTLIQMLYARVLLAEGKKDEAVAELRFAAEHLHRIQDAAEVYYHLAQALEAAGQTAEAAKYYQKLLDLWPVGLWADRAKAGLGKK